jgi:hypothetical protein
MAGNFDKIKIQGGYPAIITIIKAARMLPWVVYSKSV